MKQPIKNVVVLAMLQGLIIATESGPKNMAQLAAQPVGSLKELLLDKEDALIKAKRLGKKVTDAQFEVDVIKKLVKAKETFIEFSEAKAKKQGDLAELQKALKDKSQQELVDGDAKDLQEKIAKLQKELEA